MGRINTILFDFDGTVMDTNDAILGSWQHTFQILEGRQRPESELLKTFGEPLMVTMRNFFPDDRAEEAAEIYRSFQRNNFCDLIALFPEIEELLASLKEQGYKIGLVTSRMERTTWEGLGKYGIEKYFDTVVTCEDTDKHKPDPEPILIALEKLSSTPSESIMLGDTMFDILCAKNAGVRSVLVGWSLASDDECRAEADHFISAAAELFDLLEKDEQL